MVRTYTARVGLIRLKVGGRCNVTATAKAQSGNLGLATVRVTGAWWRRKWPLVGIWDGELRVSCPVQAGDNIVVSNTGNISQESNRAAAFKIEDGYTQSVQGAKISISIEAPPGTLLLVF